MRETSRLTQLYYHVIDITIPVPELSFASLCGHRSGSVVKRASHDDRIQMQRIKARPIAVYIIDYREMGKTVATALKLSIGYGMDFGSVNVWEKLAASFLS